MVEQMVIAKENRRVESLVARTDFALAEKMGGRSADT